MTRQTKNVNFDEIEQNMVMEWYMVSKIMQRGFSRYFPYLTFKAFVECIGKDPNFKKQDE